MRSILKWNFVILVFLLLFNLLFSCAKEKLTVDVAVLEDLLQKISTYEYGQSREILTQLADSVRVAEKSSINIKTIEEHFTTFLESDATLASKLFVCKQLSIVGTDASIPVLSLMLVEENTSDMSRYTLERIAGEKVKETLRNNLTNTNANIKVGIINSLGELQDEGSVPQLKEMNFDSDETIAIAAVAALGKIGNSDAMDILSEAKSKADGELKVRILDSILMCADKLLNTGKNNDAELVYKDLYETTNPTIIRAAALSGLVRSDDKNANDIILNALNEDTELKSTAIGLIGELPNSVDISPITQKYPALSADNQIQLLSALATFGDPEYKNIANSAMTSDDSDVRIAALRTFGVLGDETSIDLLVETALKGTPKEKTEARESLSLIRGEKVNQAIIDKIKNVEPKSKVVLVRSLGDRYVTESTDVVLNTTKDADQKVRVESFKVLSIISDPKYLPELVDGLINVQSESERREAQKTVISVAMKIEDKSLRADAIIEKLSSVETSKTKSSLVEILGKLGDEDALSILRESIQGDNAETKVAAIRALSDWPDSTPIDDLMNVAQTADDQTQKILSLRGFIRLIDLDKDRPADESVRLYQTAMKLSKQTSEKKMILSGLGKLTSLSAIEMAGLYIPNRLLQEEATLAVLNISNAIKGAFPNESKKYLNDIVLSSKNNNHVNRAKNILNQIED